MDSITSQKVIKMLLSEVERLKEGAAPKPYRCFIKPGCPFCMKFLVFMADAKLMHLIACENDTEANRTYITGLAGKATFPCIELEPGKIMFETMDLIEKFAKGNGVDMNTLKVYDYFSKGSFKVQMGFYMALGQDKAHAIMAEKIKMPLTIGISKTPSAQGYKSIESTSKPYRCFVRMGCPFCTKFLVFMADAGLAHLLDLDLDTEVNRAYIKECAGKDPTFPCIELDPGKIMFETMDLVEKFAKEGSVDMDSLPCYDYYAKAVFLVHTGFYQALGGDKAHAIMAEKNVPIIVSKPYRCFIKPGCPFCMKFLVFMADAKLMHLIACENDTEANRTYITGLAGKATFPCIELEPGKIMFETMDLIEKFAKGNGVDMNTLPAYDYYRNGAFKVQMSFYMALGQDKAHEIMAKAIAE
jgi:glutaredoxin 2